MQNIFVNGILKSKGKFGICSNCGFFYVVTWDAKLEFNSIFFCSLTGSRICHISLFSWWRGNETSSIHTFCLWKTKYQWITDAGETGKGSGSGESTRLPPTNVARVRILASTPNVELSLLSVLTLAPRGFFSGYSGFPLPLKTNTSTYQFFVLTVLHI